MKLSKASNNKDNQPGPFNPGQGASYIGPGMTVEGKITVEGLLHINGNVQGTVKVDDTLTLGESGEINGTVRTRNAMIDGHVKNSIVASGKLVLGPHSHVQGEIKTARLVIDEGAFFEAKCTMTKGKKPSVALANSQEVNGFEE